VVGAYDPAAPRAGSPPIMRVCGGERHFGGPARPGLYTAPVATFHDGAGARCHWRTAVPTRRECKRSDRADARKGFQIVEDHLLVASRSGGGAIDACAPVVRALAV